MSSGGSLPGGSRQYPPDGVRTVPEKPFAPTRLVLVRHGQGYCNVNGTVGGPSGCTGLTREGRAQVEELAHRLSQTGELGAVGSIYASPLPRAMQSARILAPALDAWRDDAPLVIKTDCDLCELHPGEADGLSWGEFAERFPVPDWDTDPTQPIAPGGESWVEFVGRAAAGVTRVAERHPDETSVVVCHAGVIEATMLRFMPVVPGRPRLGLPTRHASMTVWERRERGWLLCSYNDAAPAQQA